MPILFPVRVLVCLFFHGNMRPHRFYDFFFFISEIRLTV